MFHIATLFPYGEHIMRVESMKILKKNNEPYFTMNLYDPFEEGYILIGTPITTAFQIHAVNELLNSMIDSICQEEDEEYKPLQFTSYHQYNEIIQRIQAALKALNAYFVIEYTDSQMEPIAVTDGATEEEIMGMVSE